MSDCDWSRFSARVDGKAGVKNVYAAWTTQMDFERWFLRVAEFTISNGGRRDAAVEIQKGDRYRWLWHGYDDTVVERGIDLRNKNERLRKLVNSQDREYIAIASLAFGWSGTVHRIFLL